VNPCPVILGGSGFSIFPERLLELSGADFGIHGEGEMSLPQLITALRNGGKFEQIPGLVHRQGGRVISNPPRLFGSDTRLEAADRPAGLVEHYLQNSGMLNLQTQRGCAHACCYCTYPLIEGQTHRYRAPEDVAEEMSLLQAHGAKYLFIVDSIFNSSADHVAATCEAILRRGLALRWGCFLRPQGLTEDLMQLMARAGLSHVEFGSDSFCDSVLVSYEKRFTFADVLHSSQLARRHKIDYCHFLICGGPGETRQTLEVAYRNSLLLPEAVVMAVVGMRIYPGTAIEEQARREGLITDQTDLLTPQYYVAPGLTTEAIISSLRAFSSQSPNWIVGDPLPGYDRLVERLRKRGLAGPLWSYLAMLQRLTLQTSQPSKP
jgi:radical SAM superfamily enzyme YgiQ (UPF0313 family)